MTAWLTFQHYMQQHSMRKLLFILSVLIAHCSFGQLYLGAKAGLSIPNLQAGGSNPLTSGWSSSLGPEFGLISELKITHRFSIRAELNYSSQGGKRYGLQGFDPSQFFSPLPPGIPQYVYVDVKNDFKLNYLELPVLAKLNFPLGKRWSFFTEAGPYLAYLIKAHVISKGSSFVYADPGGTQKLLVDGNPFYFTVDQNTDVLTELKKLNFGVQAAVGVSLQTGNGIALLSIGGNYGFIPIQKDKSNGSNNTGAAIVTVGYLFKIPHHHR